MCHPPRYTQGGNRYGRHLHPHGQQPPKVPNNHRRVPHPGAFLQHSWNRDLTSAQRALWSAAGSSVDRYSASGAHGTYNGYQWYLVANGCRLFGTGGSYITTPPTLQTVPTCKTRAPAIGHVQYVDTTQNLYSGATLHFLTSGLTGTVDFVIGATEVYLTAYVDSVVGETVEIGSSAWSSWSSTVLADCPPQAEFFNTSQGSLYGGAQRIWWSGARPPGTVTIKRRYFKHTNTVVALNGTPLQIVGPNNPYIAPFQPGSPWGMHGRLVVFCASTGLWCWGPDTPAFYSTG
jgi:hypothetical protein